MGMIEGELKKQIHNSCWNVWTYDRKISDELAEKLQDKSNFNVRAVDYISERVIDEAKQEFPFDIQDNDLMEKTDYQRYATNPDTKIINWFKKWFGEVDHEESVE